MFPLRSKEQVTRHTAVCDRSRSEVGNSCHAFYRRPLTMHASQARRRILGHKPANCRRADLFFPRAGFVQILSWSKSGTPPCKSGQLEKDLGLEVSSARQAARLIIFEFMRSFFVGSSALVGHLLDLRYTGTNARNLPQARRQCQRITAV